jgi:cation/acetate symporter
MIAGLGITLLYIVRTHPFFGGGLGNAWFGIHPISCGVFGVPTGFLVIVVVSLLTPPPSAAVLAWWTRFASRMLVGEART